MKALNLSKILIAALIAASSVTAPSAQASASASAMCKSALSSDENARSKEVDNLIGAGIILGSVQFEAIAKVGIEMGFAVRQTKQQSNMENVPKKQWRDLAKFLGTTNPEDAPARRDFAIKMVDYIEAKLFSRDLVDHPLKRIRTLETKLKAFYPLGFVSSNAKQLDVAFIQFNRTLAQPHGRELLIQAFMASNETAARFIRKIQSTELDGITRIVGPATAIGPAILFGVFGYDFHDYWPGGLLAAAATGLAGSVPLGFVLVNRPEALIRRRIMVEMNRRRVRNVLKRAVLQTVGIEPKVPRGATLAAETPVADQPESKVDDATLKRAFSFEKIEVETKMLNKIKPDLGNRDYRSVSKFGSEVVARIDATLDLSALLSDRMTGLEGEIKTIENSIESGKLKVSVETANALVEQALATSGDIVIDGRSLGEFSNKLIVSIGEHIDYARDAVDKLESAEQAELNDVITELMASRDLMLPSTKVLPMTVDVAQGQRAILRELRTNLRGKKITDADSISKLVDAVAKLKSFRANLIESH